MNERSLTRMAVKKVWGLLAILVLQVFFVDMALSQTTPAPSCRSQTFTIGPEGAQATFDVAELRKQRDDLYRVLDSQFFQRASFGSEIAAIARPLDFLAPMIKSENLDENRKKFWAFLGTDAISTSLREMFFACGGVMDAAVAQLSLKISKADGERLVLLLADPAFDRVAASMPMLARLTTPSHLQLSTSAAGEQFRLNVIEKCKRFGVEAASCDALKFKS
jgi:hypothetical protein